MLMTIIIVLTYRWWRHCRGRPVAPGV